LAGVGVLWDSLLNCKFNNYSSGIANAAYLGEKGKLSIEGKTYIVQDGDILNIRFNV